MKYLILLYMNDWLIYATINPCNIYYGDGYKYDKPCKNMVSDWYFTIGGLRFKIL